MEGKEGFWLEMAHHCWNFFLQTLAKRQERGRQWDSDIWTSHKVSPFGVVKEVSPGQTMVLVKVITDAQDHITGPVQKFDPEEMKRRMMEKMQQQKPPKS